jgi:ABC-type nitrate/sulfonate/bicarbonate transport system substrate-binding protein
VTTRMAPLELGFKAFDMHELLCHFIAVRAGLYVQHGLRVTLVDTTFTRDDKLPSNRVHAACGTALVMWLRGAPIQVVFVATDRPLFWVYGRSGARTTNALKGALIAGFPSTAPPAQFLNVILEQTGLDPVRDVTILASRDDVARIGLLTAGDVDAAVISSAVPPAEMERAGFNPVCFFGDWLRVPTTGLAVTRSLLQREQPAVEALVSTFAQALALLQSDPATVQSVLAEIFRVPTRSLTATSDLLRRCFTTTGDCPSAITNGAIALMARALGIASRPSGSLYDFSLLPTKSKTSETLLPLGEGGDG